MNERKRKNRRGIGEKEEYRREEYKI